MARLGLACSGLPRARAWTIYKTISNHGPFEINAFSITFWVNFLGESAVSKVYIKIPRYIIYDKNINSLASVSEADRRLAEDDYKSLKFLSLTLVELLLIGIVAHTFIIIFTDRITYLLLYVFLQALVSVTWVRINVKLQQCNPIPTFDKDKLYIYIYIYIFIARPIGLA